MWNPRASEAWLVRCRTSPLGRTRQQEGFRRWRLQDYTALGMVYQARGTELQIPPKGEVGDSPKRIHRRGDQPQTITWQEGHRTGIPKPTVKAAHSNGFQLRIIQQVAIMPSSGKSKRKGGRQIQVPSLQNAPPTCKTLEPTQLPTPASTPAVSKIGRTPTIFEGVSSFNVVRRELEVIAEGPEVRKGGYIPKVTSCL
ncbi:hypothetical protein BGX38DRAFT_1157806 [Terfezia claveryi]|nr:hypothetical protein BGX38DRAFT_1157806 [Terfezia claveryi]